MTKFDFSATELFAGSYDRGVWRRPISELIVSVEDATERDVPETFSLVNYPNPFNPSTTIRYGLPNKSAVQLTVFNTLGQQAAVLQNGEQEAGYHQVQFDASGLSSGVYFYRLQAGNFTETRRLLLVR